MNTGPITNLQPIGGGKITNLQPIEGASPSPAVTSGDPGQSALRSGIQGAMEYPKEIGKGVVRGAQGIAQGAQPFAPQSTWEKVAGAVGGPAVTGAIGAYRTGRDLLKSAEDVRSAGEQSARSGENWAGQTLSMAENLPMVGGAVRYAETGGTRPFNPKSVGAAAEVGTYAAAPKVAGAVATSAAEFPTHVNDFLRRARSLSEVTKAGTGVLQGTIQPTITKLGGAMRNEAVSTLAQAIQQDKIQSGGQGTISGTAAHAAAYKLMDDMGYTPSPQVEKVLNRLHNTGPSAILEQTAQNMGYKDAAAAQAALAPQVWDSITRAANGGSPVSPGMSLDEAVKLRSDLGEMASRTKDAQLGKVAWQAYHDLGQGVADSNGTRTGGIAGRVNELHGSPTPFNHYNNEMRAYYDLRKGVTGEMMEPIEDRHDSIEKLKKFSSSDLTEVKDQMKKYGMRPEDIDDAQKNAKSVAAAHDAIAGKYRKSVYRLAMSGGTLAVALPISIMSVAKGAGLYGLAPMLAASYLTGKAMGIPAEMETGRLLRKLKIDPDKWNVRTPVEGPQAFNYDVPGGGSTGAGGGGSPSSPTPAAPSGITTSLDEPTEAMRPNLVDPAREKAQIVQQTRQNLRAAVDRAKESGSMAEWSRAKQELAAYDARGLDIRGRKAEDIERLKTRKAGKPR